MIQTPDHSSFPSGHAMEAFAVATVLHALDPAQRWTKGGEVDPGAAAGAAARTMPFRIAHRIATNRTVAGVHFPVDSLAGAYLGCFIGEALMAAVFGAPEGNEADGGEERADAGTLVTDDAGDFMLGDLAERMTGWAAASEGDVPNRAEEAILRQLREAVAAEWPTSAHPADGQA